MDDREKLRLLDDLVMEAILESSDAEALASLEPGDMQSIDEAVAMARRESPRRKMAQARAELAAQRARPRLAGPARIAPGHPPTSRNAGLTLAARGGGADHDADQASLDEDLAELHARRHDGG
jgi:hypothetical protein